MNQETNSIENIAVQQTGKDIMTAVFVVSVLANFVVLVAWLVINVDPALSVAITTN